MRALRNAPLALALTMVFARAAHAEPRAEDRGTALTLFTQARALMEAGDDASACPKLEEAERLAPGVGIEFNLGDCYEKTGRLASAWSMFEQAAITARGAGQREREQQSRARSTLLEPRLSHLVIVVPKESVLPGLVVRRDGRDVGAAQWGEAIKIDAGEHVITAEAPMHVGWETTVRVAGEREQTATAVPRLEKVPLVVIALPAERPVEAPPRPSALRPASVVVAAVGLAGLATWGVLGVLAIEKHAEASAHCTENAGVRACDAEGQRPNDAAVDLAHGATIALVAGGALVVAGTVLFLASPSTRPRSRATFAPMVGLGQAGAAASWAW